MRIISLTAENVKRILNVEVRPLPGLIQIAGKNGSGKSSLLDCIEWALAGDRAIEDQPIRKGKSFAKIELNLGEGLAAKYKVTKIISVKDGGGYETKLRVEDLDTGPERKAQTLLSSFIGDLTLDPVAFITADPKTRIKTLKRLVPGVNFDDLEGQRTRLADKRLEVGREVKRLEGVVASFTKPENAPEAAVDTAPMIAELETAAARQREIGEHASKRDQLTAAARSMREQHDAAVAKAAEYRALAAEEDRKAESLLASARLQESALEALPPAPEPIDTAEVRARITKANDDNEVFRSVEAYRAASRTLEKNREDYESLTKRIEGVGETIAKHIAEADLPVRGLGLTEDDVTLDGFPFEQASQAQQLRAGLAIAMAENPKLKVIRVRHGGNDLDEDAMAILKEVAEEEGFDVWIERVIPVGPAAVVMHEGRAKEDES